MDSGVIDAEPSGSHGFETGWSDGLTAGLTATVGAIVELGEGPLDLCQLVPELRSQGLVLALLGRHLTRVCEVVVDLAVAPTGF